ncbi:hypothetical protein MRX96_012335 [Rhipicephalus microplus]
MRAGRSASWLDGRESPIVAAEVSPVWEAQALISRRTGGEPFALGHRFVRALPPTASPPRGFLPPAGAQKWDRPAVDTRVAGTTLFFCRRRLGKVVVSDGNVLICALKLVVVLHAVRLNESS